MRLVDNVLALLAPVRCHWCRAATAGEPVCAACRASLPWNAHACRTCALPLPAGARMAVCAECLATSPVQDGTWAAFRYEPPISQQIVHLKFHGRLAAAHVLGALMARRLALRPEPLPALLVPVPLHARRARSRGYNQALELARALGRHLAIEIAPHVVRRVRATGEQTRLPAAARRRNVRGAFAVDGALRGRHVALVDDVVTTGATVGELARRLRAAGAGRIEVWAAARALPVSAGDGRESRSPP